VTETSKKFDLNHYIPCQLASVTQAMMRSLAALFEERFGISLPEWKVLAITRERPGLSAIAVARRAQMDTVAVSRAVTKLLDRGLVSREIDGEDRRRSVLDLSEFGIELHDQIAPVAAELEASLFEDLTEDEKQVFEKAIRMLQAKATDFTDAYSAPPRRIVPHVSPVAARRKPDPYRPLRPGPLVSHHLNGTR